MRKAITIFLMCTLHLTVLAQDNKSDYQYQPFIMDGSCEWVNAEPYNASGTVNHITKEDTIISEKTYRKIYSYTCKNPNVKTYRGAVREENKAIYYVSRHNDNTNEYKIFDFNLKVGDRINYNHPENFQISRPLILEVSKIDTVKSNNIWRRVYSFIDHTYNENSFEWKDAWIEGVGAEQDFLTPFMDIPTCCGGPSYLCGVVQNETLIHGSCTCERWDVGIDKNEIPPFIIKQNPIENKILSIEAGHTKFQLIEIYSMEGISVLTQDISLHSAAFEISLRNIEQGTYIIILTKENGDRESGKIVIK